MDFVRIRTEDRKAYKSQKLYFQILEVCAAPQQQKGDSDKGNLCCHFKVLLAYSALVL